MTDGSTEAAEAETSTLEMTSAVVAAYVMKNPIAPSDLPRLILDVSNAFRKMSNSVAETPVGDRPIPAVSVRKSITPDY